MPRCADCRSERAHIKVIANALGLSVDGLYDLARVWLEPEAVSFHQARFHAPCPHLSRRRTDARDGGRCVPFGGTETHRLPSPRGFAALTKEQRTKIARRGAFALHALGAAHQFTSEEAKAAARARTERPVRSEA